MSTQFTRLMRDRVANIATGSLVVGAPTAVADVHFVMSPKTALGQLTMGFALVVDATPSPGTTFSVRPYRLFRKQVAPLWFAFDTMTGVAAKEQLVCTDIDPCELYFQVTEIDTAAAVTLFFAEI